jgi:hypothetical protein
MVDQVRPTPTGRRPSRARSTGFPDLRLSRAAEYVRAAGTQGRNQSTTTMADYLGHTTTESGPFKAKMAALRDYGLISGTSDSIVISDDGMQIAHADDPQMAAAALRRAFLHCAIFRRAYDDSAKGRPIPLTNVGSRAVLNYGVLGAARDRFVQAFVDSAVDAGLAERRGDHVVLQAVDDLPPFSRSDDSGGAEDQQNQATTGSPAAVLGHGSSGKAGHPVVLSQSFPFDAGSVDFAIRSSRTLPTSAYSEIAGVVEAAGKLVAVLGDAPGESSLVESEDVPKQELE